MVILYLFMEETLKEISYQEQFQYNSLRVQRIVRSNSSMFDFKFHNFFFFEVQVSHLRNIYSFFIFHVMSQCFIS